MTATTTTPTEPDEPAPAADRPLHPADILMNLIVAALAPMFLGASGGDIHLARMAALETVNAYRARDHADLIAIAQIIACGLAALGSLSLSMADDISLSMALRLRGNANALSRIAEQNRRAIRDNRLGDMASHRYETAADAAARSDPADAEYEAAVVASVAETRKRVADAQAAPNKAEPAAEPASVPGPAPIVAPSAPAPVAAPTVPAPVAAPTVLMPTEHQRQAMWGTAMSNVAAEYTASLPFLPPAERKAASMRAAALNSTANALISGTAAPRLKSGALGSGALGSGALGTTDPGSADRAAIKRPTAA